MEATPKRAESTGDIKPNVKKTSAEYETTVTAREVFGVVIAATLLSSQFT
jgi:hypothetical protein